MKFVPTLLALVCAGGLFAAPTAPGSREFKIPYEKYRLPNGLQVILHVDASDPIAAVYVVYHVGSAREEPGRTGFAHLFEHLRFNESQHIPQGQWFKKLQLAGASTINGSTSRDRTNYYEVVPRNAIEQALWMEADRMGWLVGKLTPETFITQQNVVQNEKRQYDNLPYSQRSTIVDRLLYPERHPYHWQVIGSLDDLARASLQDAVEFNQRHYGASNATLVVAGDIDGKVVKGWIEKYFGEIPLVATPAPLPKKPIELKQTVRASFEDKLATAPQLSVVFPTVERYHPDSYALQYLARILAGTRKSPLYRVLVEEQQLVPGGEGGGRRGRRGGGGSGGGPALSAYQRNEELAGSLQIVIRAFPEVKLSDVERAVKQAFDRFEQEGFADRDVERQKAGLEYGFFSATDGVLEKATILADNNIFLGTPDAMATNLKAMLAVTKDDVWRVYRTYLKDRPYVLASIVPETRVELAAAESTPIVLPEESIDKQGTRWKDVTGFKPKPAPTKFDRSQEPPRGPEPVLRPPAVWDAKTAGGLPLLGIEHRELPLVQFSVVLRGGARLDLPGKGGTADLTARLLNAGTRTKTPVELREAIEDLGAALSVSAGGETTALMGGCLASRLAETVALAREILLEPRWDEREFAQAKALALEQAKLAESTPTGLASAVLRRLVYGADHPLAQPAAGTVRSLSALTLADLKEYHARAFSPKVAFIEVVGDVPKEQAVRLFQSLDDWQGGEVKLPETPPAAGAKPGLYFVDVPKARQSVVTAGHAGLPQTHRDFYRAVAMNHRLGGDFSSVLNTILRETKAYTYGARSGFSGGAQEGIFSASTQVQTNATRDTVQIIRDEITKYRGGISAAEVEQTKAVLTRSNAGKFETLPQLLEMLQPIALYGQPKDYVAQREAIVRQLSAADVQALAQKYLQPGQLVYAVVGDQETQLAGLSDLGLGAPALVDKEGRPVAVEKK